MNSNGIYAVGKTGCTKLALAKTIIFSASLVIHFWAVCQYTEGLIRNQFQKPEAGN